MITNHPNPPHGKIIVIVAPSGTGKSTLIKEIKKDFPILRESVSFTTRPKRPGEVHGVNYFYIGPEEFLERKEKNEFLEWAVVHSHFYGTSKKFVEDGLAEGQFLLFDLDVQGADAFKKHFGPQSRIIFIEPPSVEELEKRLTLRGTERPEVIRERIQNAKKELERKHDFDYLIQNDHFEKSYQQLKTLIENILQGIA